MHILSFEKVGVTLTYVNENEEQPRGLAGRIFKE